MAIFLKNSFIDKLAISVSTFSAIPCRCMHRQTCSVRPMSQNVAKWPLFNKFTLQSSTRQYTVTVHTSYTVSYQWRLMKSEPVLWVIMHTSAIMQNAKKELPTLSWWSVERHARTRRDVNCNSLSLSVSNKRRRFETPLFAKIFSAPAGSRASTIRLLAAYTSHNIRNAMKWNFTSWQVTWIWNTPSAVLCLVDDYRYCKQLSI